MTVQSSIEAMIIPHEILRGGWQQASERYRGRPQPPSQDSEMELEFCAFHIQKS